MAQPIISCRRCNCDKRHTLSAEIAVHLPNLGTPHVFLFPKLLVCVNCGFTEFVMSERELRSVIEGLATPEDAA